jgi:hypothetical protein
MPSASIFNDLNCQPDVWAHFDPQRVFPALSNLIVERDDGFFQIDLRCNAPGPFEIRAFAQLSLFVPAVDLKGKFMMSERGISFQISRKQKLRAAAPPSGAESCQSGLTASAIIQPGGGGRAGTIRILVESADRHGHWSVSLQGGTVLVRSSRQAFLDAARVLVAADYDPNSWLEGWRPGAAASVMRARLGIASGLTVDESRTLFAPWKPFSPSAVSSSIRYPKDADTVPVPGASGLVQPPLARSNEQIESILSAHPR